MSKDIEAFEQLSFEDALSELEGIVRALESGSTPLAQSIEAYERGMRLKQHCERRLADARLRVEKISLGTDGTPQGTTPFAPETNS